MVGSQCQGHMAWNRIMADTMKGDMPGESFLGVTLSFPSCLVSVCECTFFGTEDSSCSPVASRGKKQHQAITRIYQIDS